MSDACAQSRFVWNLAVEQFFERRCSGWRAPNHHARCGQLTEARAEFSWLKSGSQTVQQQALRDFAQALRNWFKRPDHFGRPTWRKAGEHEGFRQVAVKPDHVRRVSHRWGTVLVPKVGRVKFRMSKDVPDDVKSFRVTQDRAGRWWVAFAHIPPQIDGPGEETVVGVDAGVARSFQVSDGRCWQTPTLSAGESERLVRLQRRLARQRKGSNRRKRTKQSVAKLKARETALRKDLIEKATTELARTADIVRIEDLNIVNMVRSASGTIDKPGVNVAQKRGRNRSIQQQGWGLFAQRLEDKIGDRCERVPAAYTSQRCNACGVVAHGSRESQSRFACRNCGHIANADLNAALNIAAGRAVTGRGDSALAGSVKREPQLALLSG